MTDNSMTVRTRYADFSEEDVGFVDKRLSEIADSKETWKESEKHAIFSYIDFSLKYLASTTSDKYGSLQNRLIDVCRRHGLIPQFQVSGRPTMLPTPGFTLSPDGSFIVDKEPKGTLVIISTSYMRPVTRIVPITGNVSGFSFSPDSRMLAVSEGKELYIWDMTELNVKYAVDVTNGSNPCWCGSDTIAYMDNSGMLILHSMSSGKDEFLGIHGEVRAVSVSLDGTRLLVLGEESFLLSSGGEIPIVQDFPEEFEVYPTDDGFLVLSEGRLYRISDEGVSGGSRICQEEVVGRKEYRRRYQALNPYSEESDGDGLPVSVEAWCILGCSTRGTVSLAWFEEEECQYKVRMEEFSFGSEGIRGLRDSMFTIERDPIQSSMLSLVPSDLMDARDKTVVTMTFRNRNPRIGKFKRGKDHGIPHNVLAPDRSRYNSIIVQRPDGTYMVVATGDDEDTGDETYPDVKMYIKGREVKVNLYHRLVVRLMDPETGMKKPIVGNITDLLGPRGRGINIHYGPWLMDGGDTLLVMLNSQELVSFDLKSGQKHFYNWRGEDHESNHEETIIRYSMPFLTVLDVTEEYVTIARHNEETGRTDICERLNGKLKPIGNRTILDADVSGDDGKDKTFCLREWNPQRYVWGEGIRRSDGSTRQSDTTYVEIISTCSKSYGLEVTASATHLHNGMKTAVFHLPAIPVLCDPEDGSWNEDHLLDSVLVSSSENMCAVQRATWEVPFDGLRQSVEIDVWDRRSWRTFQAVNPLYPGDYNSYYPVSFVGVDRCVFIEATEVGTNLVTVKEGSEERRSIPEEFIQATVCYSDDEETILVNATSKCMFRLTSEDIVRIANTCMAGERFTSKSVVSGRRVYRTNSGRLLVDDENLAPVDSRDLCKDLSNGRLYSEFGVYMLERR